MKGSRAPGPVQSYTVLHSKRNDSESSRVRVQPSVSGRKGNKTVPAEASHGVLRKYMDLDDIPDFPSGEIVWNKPTHSSSGAASSSSSYSPRSQQSYPAPQRQEQPLPSHSQYQYQQDDDIEEVYEDLGYGQSDPPDDDAVESDEEAAVYASPPKPAAARHAVPPRTKKAVSPAVSAPPLPCEQPPVEEVHSSEQADPKKQLYFSKQPRAVEFRPYTLKQYSLIKPKDYVEIAKMQPDLNTDELVAKRKNAERIKEFSKQLRAVNSETLSAQRKLPSAAEQSDIEKSKQKYESKRQRALEFAKMVVKPGPGSDPLDEDGEGGFGVRSMSAGQAQPTTKKTMRRPQPQPQQRMMQLAADNEDGEAAARLLELEARHSQSKAQVDAIRRAMGGVR